MSDISKKSLTEIVKLIKKLNFMFQDFNIDPQPLSYIVKY